MAKYNKIGEVLNFNPDSIPTDWYSETFTVSTAGGLGCVWERKECGEIKYTISTNTVRSVPAQNRRVTFRFKRHYVLTEKGFEEISCKLTLQSL